MMTRKFRPMWIHLVLNGILLTFVAALLLFAVTLVRTKLLQNAQSLGMALVHSYALEEEMNRCASDYARLQELEAEMAQVSRELDEKMERWLYLNELAEAIAAQEGLHSS